MSIIELNVSKTYTYTDDDTKEEKEFKVLDSIVFSVELGQLVLIRGESGSGKTTLLRILGLIDRNFTGHYKLCGMDLITRDSHPYTQNDLDEIRALNFGFIFQEDRLFEHLNIISNIYLPIRIHSLPQEYDDTVAKFTQMMYRQEELDEQILYRKRAELSGGQRQRAALLRALAHSPHIIIADEPTASLDQKRKRDVVDKMKKLCEEGHTIIVASHDEVFSDKADAVYEIKDAKLNSVKDNLRVENSLPDTQPTLLNDACRQTWNGLKPRAPFSLQIAFAWRDLFRNIIFTLLIIGTLAITAFQTTLFISVNTGTNKIVDDMIREGSRLTRIDIRPKDMGTLARFPDLPSIKNIPGVLQLIKRREGVYRVKDKLGRARSEILFGLETGDPELKQLIFMNGSGFSSETAFETVISEKIIPHLFEVPGDVVSKEFREALIGKNLEFMICKPLENAEKLESSECQEPWSNTPMEPLRFHVKITGIVTQAEPGRNLYLPKQTQAAFETWRLGKSDSLNFLSPEGTWTVPETVLLDWSQKEILIESLYIYLDTIDAVIPAYQTLTALGYGCKSPLIEGGWRWLIDARNLAKYLLLGLVTLVLLVGGLNIANNIFTAVRIRQKEIVMLKLLGMRNGDIFSIYILNAVMAATIGTIVGFLSGTAVVSYLSDFLSDYYGNNKLTGIFAPVGASFWDMLMLFAGLAVVFALLPAYHAGKTDPVRGFES